MSHPRKYNLPTPPPTTVKPSPAEIIELTGKRKKVRGTPVELVSAGPPLEIIEASAVPHLQLVVTLRLSKTASDPARVALAAARFLAAIQQSDARLRLILDPVQSRTTRGEIILVLLPGLHRVETADRLEKVAKGVRTIAAGFEGAVLKRVEVIPQR